MLNKAELLLPAGSLVKLKTAVLYGADAVYAGTPDMCLRAQSKFSMEDLQEGIDFAHAHGKKIYLTLNLFMHNRDVEKLPKFVETLRQLRPDGVLIADPGVFQYVRENAPELNLFVSTQANICSSLAVKFWQNQGAKLCVLGRELHLKKCAKSAKTVPTSCWNALCTVNVYVLFRPLPDFQLPGRPQRQSGKMRPLLSLALQTPPPLKRRHVERNRN